MSGATASGALELRAGFRQTAAPRGTRGVAFGAEPGRPRRLPMRAIHRVTLLTVPDCWGNSARLVSRHHLRDELWPAISPTRRQREGELVHPRQRMRAAIVEQRDFVVVAAQRVLRAIGDEQGQLLAPAACPRPEPSTSSAFGGEA